MKRHSIILLFSIGILCLSGCSRDEDISIDTRPLLSYFKGIVNDESILYEQRDRWDNKIWCSSVTKFGGKIIRVGWYMNLLNQSNDTIKINIALFPVRKGLYEIVPPIDYDNSYSEIEIRYATYKGQNVRYRPSEQSPFQVYINNIDDSYDSPIITGRMNGILYNRENPKDSIEIKEASFRIQDHPKASLATE